MQLTLVEVMALCEGIAWKTKCFRHVNMLNSTTVALNLVKIHRYTPQSCRSPDDGCSPDMTRTAMIRKDLQEPHESEVPGCQAENAIEVIPPHKHVRYTRTDIYDIYDTQERCY